jgi:hypothetical protein
MHISADQHAQLPTPKRPRLVTSGNKPKQRGHLEDLGTTMTFPNELLRSILGSASLGDCNYYTSQAKEIKGCARRCRSDQGTVLV